jgi:hypothetical protein
MMNVPFSLQDLILHGDGQCNAWAGLWYGVLKVQGGINFNTKIGNEEQPVLRLSVKWSYFAQQNPGLSLTGRDDEGFLVKNWSFTNTPTGGNPNWNYVNQWAAGRGPISSSTYDIHDSRSYHFKNPDVQKGAGVPGQHNPNPKANFVSHTLLVIGDAQGTLKYYDPSYGKVYTTESGWVAESVAGYYFRSDSANSTYWFIRKFSPNDINQAWNYSRVGVGLLALDG